MGKYAIYKFELTRVDGWQRELPLGEEMEIPISDHANENFERLFGRKGSLVRVLREKRKNDFEPCPCHVLAHDNNVILLRLENVKNVIVYESQYGHGPIPQIEKKQYESNPPCRIVIDNREGKNQIAIEIESAAWSKTSIVRNLIEANFNRDLERLFGLHIKITSKMRTSSYWDYVDYRRKKEGRSIKRMTFSFPNANIRPSIETAIGLSPHLRSLMRMLNDLGGAQGELTVQPPTDDVLLRRKLEDIKKMVALCASSDYSLSVTFDDDITYKCNEDLRAELPMNRAHALKDFEEGQKSTFYEYEIEEWLDWVVEQTKDYSHEEQVKPKPNRKDKHKVS